MKYLIKYAILFIAVVLLQMLIFNNISLSIYIAPLIYITFILLLPLETPPIATLGLGLLLGVITDLSMATVGINTIATLFTSYTRYWLLLVIMGKETIKNGGIITAKHVGVAKFYRYITIATTIHCTIFFLLESMQWEHELFILCRIAASSLSTIILVVMVSLLLNNRESLRI